LRWDSASSNRQHPYRCDRVELLSLPILTIIVRFIFKQMHEEAEQEQPVEVSPPSQQPILLTPTKQVSKDNHLLTTLHCSRQLVFVLTPTKQEPEMFSSLLSEEKSGMVEELGMS
jgi:hypothetical protein